VETGLHYPVALSRQPALAGWRWPCPNAELAASEVLSLPMHPMLSLADVDLVCDALLDAESTLGVGPDAPYAVAGSSGAQ
jgi:dTDP-4-amino-4,6-dideoxygalactose transaminase